MNFKSVFSKINRVTLILTIVYFVTGLMFCILPSFMMETLEVIVCAALLIYGTIILFANSISSVVSENRKLLFSAIIAMIVGIFLLFVRSFFILVLAIYVLGLAIFKTVVLIKIKNIKNMNWYIWLSVAIVHFSISVLSIIFFALNKFLIESMILIGISLILDALGSVFIFVKNQKNEQIQAFKEENKEKKD